jgi:hypothetical protein
VWIFEIIQQKVIKRKRASTKQKAMEDDFADEPIVISLQLKNP